MRLIDADALCEDLIERWNLADKQKEELIQAVMADIVTPIVVSQPTIKSEQKTGEWLVTESMQDGQITWLNYKCSECGHHRDRKMNYCEVCGAKMEKKQHG